MIIAFYGFFKNVAPQIDNYARELVNPIMEIVVIVTAIVLIFGAVGIRIFNNLGLTVVGAAFRVIRLVILFVFRAIVWAIRATVFRMIPWVFNRSRRLFNHMGVNGVASNILAIVVVIAFVIIVI